MNANTEFSDGLARCRWVDTSAEYMAYHDREWGYPEADDRALFEQLCLEGFPVRPELAHHLVQARGVPAWLRRVRSTQGGEIRREEVLALLADAGIVRHRGKIEAVINNAARALEMIEREGSLGAYLWRFEARRAPSTYGASRPAQSRRCPRS